MSNLKLLALVLIAGFGLLLLIVAMYQGVQAPIPTEENPLAATVTEPTPPLPTSTPTHEPNLGMTYGGKLGIEIVPNLVIPFDGSGLNLGFGF